MEIKELRSLFSDFSIKSKLIEDLLFYPYYKILLWLIFILGIFWIIRVLLDGICFFVLLIPIIIIISFLILLDYGEYLFEKQMIEKYSITYNEYENLLKIFYLHSARNHAPSIEIVEIMLNKNYNFNTINQSEIKDIYDNAYNIYETNIRRKELINSYERSIKTKQEDNERKLRHQLSKTPAKLRMDQVRNIKYSNNGDYKNNEIRAFINEDEIERYLIKNIESIEKGLVFLERQRIMEVGRLDILAKDKMNRYVVIELKRELASDRVVGQITRYMGEIKRIKNSSVRGIIIAESFDKRIIASASCIPNLQLIELSELM